MSLQPITFEHSRPRPVKVTRRGANSLLSNVPTNMTLAGEEWAVRAISPCDERFQDGRQIPDMSTTGSAVITNRILTTIEPPSDTTTLWDLHIIALPFSDIAFIYKAFKSGTDYHAARWNAVTYQDVQAGTMWVPNVANSTQFATTNKVGTLRSYTEQYRSTQKGMTISLNASALNNQGMVLAGQYGDKPVLTPHFPLVYVNGATAGAPVDEANDGSAWILNDIPTNTAELFAKDSHAVRMNAKQGVYLPLKFNDAVSLYSKVQDMQVFSEDGLVKGPGISTDVPIVLRFTGETSSDYMLRFGAVGDNSTRVYQTAGDVNHLTGVVIFTGLSVNASIDVKTVAALEVISAGDGPWNGFMREPPVDDDSVLKQVHAVQLKLPSAHPASFNFLGTLLTTLAPALGSLAGQLIGALGRRWTSKSSTPSV